jgi:hypothetical protein
MADEDSRLKNCLESCSKSRESLQPLDPVFRYLEPFVLMIFFTIFGFMLGYGGKSILTADGTIITILILLPILGYSVLSGKLSSIKGPGGFEAQFTDASQQKIKVDEVKSGYSIIESEKIESENLQDISEGGESEDKLNNKILPNLRPLEPFVMTFILGNNYNIEKSLEYLKALVSYKVIKFAVFLNTKNEFVAYTSLPRLKHILTIPNEDAGKHFFRDIQDSNITSLLNYPGIITTTISTISTNTEALQTMLDHDLEAIIVVENQNLKGIVQREKIINKLILSLAKRS